MLDREAGCNTSPPMRGTLALQISGALFLLHTFTIPVIFLKKNFVRKRSGGDQQQQQQQQRRLRRAPSARGNSKAEAYQMAVKHK